MEWARDPLIQLNVEIPYFEFFLADEFLRQMERISTTRRQLESDLGDDRDQDQRDPDQVLDGESNQDQQDLDSDDDLDVDSGDELIDDEVATIFVVDLSLQIAGDLVTLSTARYLVDLVPNLAYSNKFSDDFQVFDERTGRNYVSWIAKIGGFLTSCLVFDQRSVWLANCSYKGVFDPGGSEAHGKFFLPDAMLRRSHVFICHEILQSINATLAEMIEFVDCWQATSLLNPVSITEVYEDRKVFESMPERNSIEMDRMFQRSVSSHDWEHAEGPEGVFNPGGATPGSSLPGH